MKRLLHTTILWRLTAIALIVLVAAVASAPPAALGGPNGPNVAVIQFQNNAGAPGGTVTALSNALYQAVESSGHFTAVGGGPLNPPLGVSAEPLAAAVEAGAKAQAEEIILGDILRADASGVLYRLTAYRVEPLQYIRSEVFSQSNTSSGALASGFATDLSTLNAPRTSIGTIYSITNGVHADLGAIEGFKLGQRFNVVRAGNKMAEAFISAIEDNDATVTITNASAGYVPVVGDRLVAVDPAPALQPAPRAGANTFNFFALVGAVGAALLAIGHHGQPAGFVAFPSPSPTSSVSAFTVSCGTPTGAPPGPVTFTFNFNLPVNVGQIQFAGSTKFVSYTTTNPVTPTSPVTGLGGAPPSFDATQTVLTINATNLTPGEGVQFTFTNAIMSNTTPALALQPANCNSQFSVARHPLVAHTAAPEHNGGAKGPPVQPHQPVPVPPQPGPRKPK